ncbi:McrC family protein [Haloplanus aerogenes]|uniref:Restriction endonuclease n=1 Tax=Haloplanus aerogenes TaxID=660522 RepID=A0A3M0CQ54_9EURY|nr:restriction endonuclease [Haloplanus aerogenes]AZH26008.1 restriction endonuclease [Haloplanus aerogenes]RMB11711.1 5-methylcytosine-specific restriction endonuclease McrBC regulatory subunit McrC [Haloplanus aerogenes]
MSIADPDESYTYEPGTFSISERGEIRIEGCPPSIGEQLRRASFEQEADNIFVKTQKSLDDREKEYRVVRVRLDEPVMYVTARDNVGIISLTPRSKLRIEPKIDWNHIFDMLLAVHGRRQSIEYHGIPLSEFRTEDVDLQDVFLILAINYLNGLEDVHRNGFVRQLETRRADLEQPRGVIDIERSLVNQAEGRAQQHCLLKEVDYDNPANSLLHYAGIHLLHLFQQYEDKYDHQAYYHIFSQVHQEVRHLERLGVDSGRRRIPEYRHFSLHELPKQRHYYRQAIEVAKAIVASSLGTPAMQNNRELVVDYVLNMESLFEQYSQVVIEDELEVIKSLDRLDQTENIAAVRSPTVQPFENESNVYHQPDHAVEKGDETLAVLDSKYYAEEKDPVKSGSSRSRLFSYAYLLTTDRMGFLTPLNKPRTRSIAQTGAELQVISPNSSAFSLDEYRSCVRDYLHDVLAEQYPALTVYRAVEEHALCLDQHDMSDLDRLTESGGPFDFSSVHEFSLRVVNAAADTLTSQQRSRSDLEQKGKWTRRRIETQCDEQSSETMTCVPVFRREDGEERIDLYFITHDEAGNPIEVSVEDDLRLL